MHLINSCINSTKAIKNLVKGRNMGGASLGSGINLKYALFGLLPSSSKSEIQCILCGYPRSGTHWIRSVIEKSSNYKTYDLFGNRPTKNEKKILVVKIHARNKLIARTKARFMLHPHKFLGQYIYTYRDPRDTMISLFEMYKKKKSMPELEAKEFIKFYDPIRQYRWEIGSWVIPKHENVLLVRFEDLKLNSENEFKRIFDFLKIVSPIDEDAIGEKVGLVDVTKRPRATVFGWKSAPEEYRNLIDYVSLKLKKEIKMLGYER